MAERKSLLTDDMDYLHGSEWIRIFNNAHALYSVNRTTMLSYASRRNAKNAIEKSIENLGKSVVKPDI